MLTLGELGTEEAFRPSNSLSAVLNHFTTFMHMHCTDRSIKCDTRAALCQSQALPGEYCLPTPAMCPFLEKVQLPKDVH